MTHEEAENLNEIIRMSNPAAYNLLSRRGKNIFFPKEGIISQSADAVGKKYNATIGIATEDDGSPMRMESIERLVSLPPADVFPYASSYGKPDLRKAWKELILRKNHLASEISLPVVVHALSHGLSMAGYLFVDEGDRIIAPDTLWENYRLVFENAYGGIIDTFAAFDGDKFNVEGLRKKLAGKGKKIVLLNFPNNPSGYTPSHQEADEIVSALKESAEAGSGVVVIIDDAYFGFVYADAHKESFFGPLSNLHRNVVAVKIDGVSKEYYAWGLRVGFITFGWKGGEAAAYKAMEDKAAGAVRGSISSACNLSQSLVLAALKSDEDSSAKYDTLKVRFEKVRKVVESEKFSRFFSALPYNSGYFMCIKLVSGNAERVRQRLLAKYDTGVIASGNLLRIAFSSIAEKNIEALFENIYNACKEEVSQ